MFPDGPPAAPGQERFAPMPLPSCPCTDHRLPRPPRRFPTARGGARVGRALALGALLLACAGPLRAATPPVAAATPSRAAPIPPGAIPPGTALARIVLAPLPLGVRVLGEVDSLGKTTLVAPVTGEVVGPFLGEGEVPVHAIIARNVPATLRSALAAARANLLFARAAAARTRQLVAQRLRTQIALDQARRNLAEAEGQLAGLRRQATQQVIRAPFAGTLHYLIAPGTVVYKGTPIATLNGRATPWIDARLSPAEAAGLHAGDPARVTATSWAGPAVVVSVGRDARPLGLVRVRLGLPAGNPLLPGEWVWVRLTRPGAPALAVPRAALLMRGAQTLVFVRRHGRAHEVPVRVLAERDGRAFVTGTLKAGEQVALRHVARLAEGTKLPTAPDPLGARR